MRFDRDRRCRSPGLCYESERSAWEKGEQGQDTLLANLQKFTGGIGGDGRSVSKHGTLEPSITGHEPGVIRYTNDNVRTLVWIYNARG